MNLAFKKDPFCTDNSRENLSRWAWAIALALIALFALAMRWYYVEHAVVYNPLRGDAIQYHAYAWNLVHHGVFSKSPPDSLNIVSDNFRDPGYPLLLALELEAFPDFSAWYPIVQMTQGILGALTVILLMCAGRRWLPDRWLIFAGLLMAAWPHSIAITSFLLSETQYSFLCALAFYFLSRALEKSSTRWGFIAGLAFGAGALTNAVLLPFAPLLALSLYLRHKTTRQVLLTLAISSLLLPMAWGIRNAQLPTGDSAGGRALINLVQGSWPEYHTAFIKSVFGNPEGFRLMEPIQHEYDVLEATPSKGIALMYSRISSQPARYLWWYLSKPALLWDWEIRVGQGDIYVYPTSHSPFVEITALRFWISLCKTINPLLMIMALTGAAMALGKKTGKSPIATAAAILAVYVTLLYSILQSEPRYSISYRGIEVLLAVYAVEKIVAWLQDRRQAGLTKRYQVPDPA
jgi:4-amino-4-deoxy-L-arabinose transferase-like glycosyltransferase